MRKRLQSRFDKALPLIQRAFHDRQPHIYRYRELVEFIQDHQMVWNLTGGVNDKIQALVEGTELHPFEFVPVNHPHVPIETRYSFGRTDPFYTALSLKPGSFLSHASAMFVHKLTHQIPRQIFVNKEQSSKPPSKGSLSQGGIDRAFSAVKQRQSQYLFRFDDDNELLLLSGKNTGRLGVEPLDTGGGFIMDTTNLERTLIDIVVRPAYAGGVAQVIDAFRSARERVSIGSLIATLRQIGYVYPYHQAIGYYMQKAGFSEQQYARLQSLPQEFNFYLTYGMKDPDYVSEWKLFVPKGL